MPSCLFLGAFIVALSGMHIGPALSLWGSTLACLWIGESVGCNSAIEQSGVTVP